MIPLASGAVVMGTGIMSIALFLDGHEVLSIILLVIATVAWVALGIVLITRFRGDRTRVHAEARLPASLTGVAGTAVLGTRLVLLGWSTAGIALLIVALALWLVLIGSVLGNWTVPTVGASFILTVSTESLALLTATLALDQHAHWLLGISFAPYTLGLAFYLFVLARFDFHQLIVGRGDHWVCGGALAISAVVSGRITLAATALGMLTSYQGTLRHITLGLWTLAILWLPVLLAVEALYPRLHYDVRRWSTVFPVGMYAASSFIDGEALNAPRITSFAATWVWVAVSVWLVTFTAMLRRGAHIIRDTPPRPPPT